MQPCLLDAITLFFSLDIHPVRGSKSFRFFTIIIKTSIKFHFVSFNQYIYLNYNEKIEIA